MILRPDCPACNQMISTAFLEAARPFCQALADPGPKAAASEIRHPPQLRRKDKPVHLAQDARAIDGSASCRAI